MRDSQQTESSRSLSSYACALNIHARRCTHYISYTIIRNLQQQTKFEVRAIVYYDKSIFMHLVQRVSRRHLVPSSTRMGAARRAYRSLSYLQPLFLRR